MGIFGKLFKGGKQISLIEYLDSIEETDKLYEMLRTRSASEIKEACRTFPIETLRLDYSSIQQDFRNCRRFEVITNLAEILLHYKEILEKRPDLRMPRSLPAEELANILMSRLMPLITSQQGVDIAHILRVRLYGFAMALMQAGFASGSWERALPLNRDALTCLLVSKPSVKEDHEFWICACRYNIAQATKNPDDIAAAIESAEQIVSGKIRVPEKYVQGARQMLSELRKLW